MKLLTDDICCDQKEVVAIQAVQKLSNNGQLDTLISKACGIKKSLISIGKNILYINSKAGDDEPKSYFLGEPSVLFCGMTPIYYEAIEGSPYDVVDRNTIEEIGEYIVFAGCSDGEKTSNTGNQLFVMDNNCDTKNQLYRYKSASHAKNVEMWLSGELEPINIPELTPILKQADVLRKKAMEESAAKKAKAQEEKLLAKEAV